MTHLTEPFCPSRWFSRNYPHRCLKRKGHEGACWCCGPEDGYPGGDLSLLSDDQEQA